MTHTPPILTIAGSDSGGGAGIQADLKTIAMHGCYGLSVITALTAQNTRGVTGIEAPTPEFVGLQLDAVLDDFEIAAAKTGMLFSAEIIRALASRLKRRLFPLVVDPVCVSQSGHRLLKPEAESALIREFLPLADLLTPNRPEAELICGFAIETREDRNRAIGRMLEMGAGAVLLKGGHFSDSGGLIDTLGLGDEIIELPQRRIATPHTHGTGCTLSAAIASRIGLGDSIQDAVVAAQAYLNFGLRAGEVLGKGLNPPNHIAPLLRDRARIAVLKELERAGDRMCAMPGLAALVPEVRMNLALAVPWAEAITDVAAFHGRITATRTGRLIIAGCPDFAASSHMAKVVLAAARVVPALRCAVNIRYNRRILAALTATGMVQAWFNRADEPKEVKEKEGSTLEWGTFAAMSGASRPENVDCVCDPGESGKEPIIRLLGRDADEVLSKLERVLKALEV